MAYGGKFLTVGEAAEFLDVAPNTIRHWDALGKIAVTRHPQSNYRLFTRQDLQRVLRQIRASGEYPTGWRPPRSRKAR